MSLGAVPISDPPPEPSLAARIAAGDAHAFEQLFERYADRLARYVDGYIRSREEAEDLVQEVFLVLWRRRAELTDVRELEAYLHTFARHRALDHLKRRSVEARWRGTYAAPESDDEWEARELVAALRRAVDTLPERQRAVLLLRWQREASYQDIATELGIGVATVGTHLSRALEHLRRILPRLL